MEIMTDDTIFQSYEEQLDIDGKEMDGQWATLPHRLGVVYSSKNSTSVQWAELGEAVQGFQPVNELFAIAHGSQSAIRHRSLPGYTPFQGRPQLWPQWLDLCSLLACLMFGLRGRFVSVSRKL